MGLLSWLIFLPLPVLVAILLLPKRLEGAGRWFALAVTLVQLGLVLGAVLPACAGAGMLDVSTATPGPLYLVERLGWFQLQLGQSSILKAEYFLAVDGLSVLMALLHAILMPIAVLASWQQKQSIRGYFALLLLLDVAVLGSFLALDLLLFYLFFEFMLLPMYFLIGIWGGERRMYAAVKFFIYTLLGSVLMLVVVIGLPLASSVLTGGVSVHSFALPALANTANLAQGSFYQQFDFRLIAFGLLMAAFAIKLPAIPLHTWLPDAHVEASTPISVLLAGILLKAGGYGIIRVAYGLFPDAGLHLAFWVGLAGVVSILGGSLLAIAQKDLKRMVAYSSIAHMGYVLLGVAALTAAGLNGAMLQLFNHGLVSAMLFLLVGVLYDRVHSRQIAHFSGLWDKMPRYTGLVMVAFFAGLGLPVTNSFISEFLVLAGAFGSPSANGLLPYILASLAILGVVLSAVYFIWTLQRMFLGPYRTEGGPAWDGLLTDLTLREHLLLWPLAALILLYGIWPGLGLDYTTGWTQAFLQQLPTAR